MIPTYCPKSSAPSPSAGSNVQSTSAITSWQQSLGASTTYLCELGYSGTPSSTCYASTSSTGVWSAISGSCTGTVSMNLNNLYSSMSLVHNNFLFNSLEENLKPLEILQIILIDLSEHIFIAFVILKICACRDLNSRLSIVSQALFPLSHCRAAHCLHIVLSIYVVQISHFR